MPINSAYSQVFYSNLCEVACNICKPSNPTRVEYRADPKKNQVVRLFGDKDIYIVPKCTVVDKDNWTCEGVIWNYREYGKQFAVNGVAYWENGVPLSREVEDKYRVCTYDKNILGQYKLRK